MSMNAFLGLCRKTALHFAAKRPCFLRHNMTRFAANYDALCGKMQHVLRQNTARFVTECYRPDINLWMIVSIICDNSAKICKRIWRNKRKCLLLQPTSHKYTINKQKTMKVKNDRLEALRLIISSQQLGSQEELLNALQQEGFKLTQATLSRDLKQLKVAKAATMGGNYVYVLPNDTMYKRVSTPTTIREMMQMPGFVSINFSGNMAVIKTHTGYASALAWNIDRSNIPHILGTVAGGDTIFLVIQEGVGHQEVIEALSAVVPNIRQ